MNWVSSVPGNTQSYTDALLPTSTYAVDRKKPNFLWNKKTTRKSSCVNVRCIYRPRLTELFLLFGRGEVPHSPVQGISYARQDRNRGYPLPWVRPGRTRTVPGGYPSPLWADKLTESITSQHTRYAGDNSLLSDVSNDITILLAEDTPRV